jgi:gamma-polyglutamate biosynthesis protein CapA
MSDNSIVTLAAVGDIMLGDNSISIGHGVGSIIKEHGAEYIFKNVSGIFHKADIIFGNLECVLSETEINPSDIHSITMRASESSINGLTYAGFNVLSIANNHILEHGENSVLRTQKILSENGIKTVGVSENKKESREPIILNKNGISIGFLAYCLVRDKTAYCSVEDPYSIVNDVKEAKKRVDFLVISLHWGNEYVHKPSNEQFLLSHEIIDAGANLILGHHPHVLQGVEKYKGGIIVFSMGNFVFDMWQRKMRESMIFSCRFSKNKIIDFEIIPVYINDFYQPIILCGEKKEKLLSKITKEYLRYADNDAYKKEVNKCRNKYRLDLAKYLATNFYNYKPTYLYQILENSIKRRL